MSPNASEVKPLTAINPLERGAEELLAQESYGYWTSIWREVRKSRAAVLAMFVLLVMSFIAVAAPLLANHRPLVMYSPEQGYSFPLFKALSVVDWSLQVGSALLIWCIIWRWFLLRAGGRSHPLIVLCYVPLSLFPIPWALTLAPWERWETGPMPGALWWWGFGIVGLLGLVLLAKGAYVVAVGKTDEWGRDLTGPALRRLFVGSLLIVVSAAMMGTLSRPKLDTTDYYKEYRLEAEQGSWAIFAPFTHNFADNSNYMRNQPPLSPRVRVLRSGTSEAAAELALTDQKRNDEVYLADAYEAGPLTADTPLAALNFGQGVSLHKDVGPDFTITATDGRECAVILYQCSTLGEIVARINASAIDQTTGHAIIEATLDIRSGIHIRDLTASVAGEDPSAQPPQSPPPPSPTITPASRSRVAEYLGLVKGHSADQPLVLADTVKDGILSQETPVSALRDGKGIKFGPQPIDFTIVAEDLSLAKISLAGTRTLGDVVERINQQARTRRGDQIIRAGIDPLRGMTLESLPAPRPTHWLGTDDSGSDVTSRIIIATRVALSIGFVSTSIAIIIGVTFGAIIGYFGGWVDLVGMRIIEIFMAIPRLFLLLTIIVFLPPQWNQYMLYAMMVVVGLTSWMGAARFIRAEFFRLREMDFIQAARACGLPLRSILFKHMLPNGVTPVLVDASFGVAAAIFLETSLSFLGFGIKPPDPSWGQMLSSAVDPSTGVFHWWLAIFPGIMIFLTLFSFILIGDALRDAIDPKLKKAAAI